MTTWKPPQIPDSEDYATKEHIVVPRAYLRSTLRTAYKIPLAGHLVINKTCKKKL